METTQRNMLLIDKPKGMSSAAALNYLKKKLGVRKAGHAGTLDPLATGLLLVGINEGTKQLAGLLKQDKVYDVEILLGTSTDTGDITGVVIHQEAIPRTLDDVGIKNVAMSLVGEHMLSVPRYSAIKQHGKPLYAYMRAGRGSEVIVPIRAMQVYEVVYRGVRIEHNQCVVMLTISVASGVYIRSLVEDFGKRLKVPATLYNLRRTHIGMYDVKDAQLL